MASGDLESAILAKGMLGSTPEKSSEYSLRRLSFSRYASADSGEICSISNRGCIMSYKV
jgi:hypothetical protein